MQSVNAARRRVPQMPTSLAACRETAGCYNRLPYMLYVFEYKTQYILVHTPYIPASWYFDISIICPHRCRRVIFYDEPMFCIIAIFVKYCSTTVRNLMDNIEKQITRHFFYATSSFLHNFVTISEFKPELRSGNAQIGAKFVVTSVTLTFDLWPWPSAYTSLLSIVITPWTDGQTDRQTGRQTDRQIDGQHRSWGWLDADKDIGGDGSPI